MEQFAPHDVSGEGVPVVLLHGSMNTRRQWRGLQKSLEATHQVIAVDLAGYGEAAFPENPDTHTMEAEAHRVRHLIYDVLGCKGPCHLVGHSYGGAISLCFAVLFPQDSLSLTLFEPMSNHLLVGRDDTTSENGIHLIADITAYHERGDDIGGSRAFFNHLTGTDTFDFLPEGAQKALSVGVKKMLLDYRTTMETGFTLEDYCGIEVPICLMRGKESPRLTTAVTGVLMEAIPKARHVTTPGDHMAPVFYPQDVNGEVMDHIAWVEGESKGLKVG